MKVPHVFMNKPNVPNQTIPKRKDFVALLANCSVDTEINGQQNPKVSVSLTGNQEHRR